MGDFSTVPGHFGCNGTRALHSATGPISGAISLPLGRNGRGVVFRDFRVRHYAICVQQLRGRRRRVAAFLAESVPALDAPVLGRASSRPCARPRIFRDGFPNQSTGRCWLVQQHFHHWTNRTIHRQFGNAHPYRFVDTLCGVGLLFCHISVGGAIEGSGKFFLLVSLLLDGGTAPWLRHEVFYAGTIWQALPFALGCRLAWAKLPKMQTPVAIAALGILMAYVVAASRFGAAFSGDSSHYFAAVLACAAIIACESVPQGRVGRLMADLSYPVYIIQFPAMALVRFLHGWSFVAAAPFAALVAGIAINRVVEAPIARVRARIRSQATLLDERKVAISLVK